MIPATTSNGQSKKIRKANLAKIKRRPVIEPEKLYTRGEVAILVNRHENTIYRAWKFCNLAGRVIGNRVGHFGWQILEWLDAGGKTGPYPGQKRKS
jgi:hypothetical protein